MQNKGEKKMKVEVGETKKQRKRNMKEDEWRGAKKEDGETKK